MSYVGPLEEPEAVDVGAARDRGTDPVPTNSIDLCGVRVTRTTVTAFLRLMRARLVDPTTPPLAAGSVNLDHLHHFGRRGGVRRAPATDVAFGDRWLLLADGAPISWRAGVLSGEHWPRLAGADLLPITLRVAADTGVGVGFLGGTPSSVAALREQLAARWPDLRLAGCWTPDRAALVDPDRSAELADEIARAGTDLLVVGLGKPLQERWIEQHGDRTGARVHVAFGGAADFLGGTTRRAPTWMRERGLEWLFRLWTEPRRLARRYLVQGPPAMARLLAHRPDARRR